MSRMRGAAVAAALIFGAGCSDPVQPPPVRYDAGIRAIDGAGQVDTIGAFLPRYLTITVAADDGTPLRFHAVHATPLRTAGDQATLLAVRLTPPYQAVDALGTAVDTTDAQGVVRFRIRLGEAAGRAGVVVRSSGLPEDTVWYEVQPGQPHRLLAEPRDSAVLVGGTYALRTGVVDRAGQLLPGAVELRVIDGPVTLDGTGRLTGTAWGRARVLAEAGAMRDTAFVSVVPEARLAAYLAPLQPGDTGRLVVFRSDGSDYRMLAERVIPFVGPTSRGFWPAWSPDGDRVAFMHGGRFEIVNVATGASQVIGPAGGEPVAEDFPPEFGPTGEWIYFTRGYLGGHNTVWRMRTDGSGAAQVSPAGEWGLEQRGSVSPDGRRMVYQTNRSATGQTTAEPTLRVLDKVTGEIIDLQPGRFPRWSPDGQWIGYEGAGGLRVVRPDGSGDRSLDVGGFEPSFDWLADAAWLVMDRWTPSGSRLELVHVPSGMRLPLGYTRDMRMAAFSR